LSLVDAKSLLLPAADVGVGHAAMRAILRAAEAASECLGLHGPGYPHGHPCF